MVKKGETMNPNEKLGAQLILVMGLLACFLVGTVAFSKGMEKGYYNGRNYIDEPYDDFGNTFDNVLEDMYPITPITGCSLGNDDCLNISKKLDGGNEHGYKYYNSGSKPKKPKQNYRRTENDNSTPTKSGDDSKQKFKKNLQNLGRFFQNSWYIGVALARN